MRGNILNIYPTKYKILIEMVWKIKMQNSILPNFEISILEQFGFPKNEKSAPQNLKFDFDFEFWG